MALRMTLMAMLIALTAGQGAEASPYRPLPGERAVSSDRPAPRAGLPFARGREFASLDEYLAFRKEGGAIDLPWYKEVAPGIYELQTNVRPAAPARRITRTELARKFGFDH